MEHIFRMCGRKVEVCHYAVTYTENRPDDDGNLTEVTVTRYFPTEKEAQMVAERNEGSIAAIDSFEYDWMDGMTVADVPDTYAEAVNIFTMGETEYTRRQEYEKSTQAGQLRSDIDEILSLAEAYTEGVNSI